MQGSRVVQEYCKLRQMVVSVSEEVSGTKSENRQGKYLSCLNREDVCAEISCRFACDRVSAESLCDPF